MNYEPQLQSHHLLLDLADGISGINALDQAVSVLIEWGFIDADIASKFINELQEGN
jgi:hypothetical protein